MTMGETIRAARIRFRLSQEALGALIGVQRQSVSDWENDKRYPSRRALVGLRDVLGLEFPARCPGPQPADRTRQMKAQAQVLVEGMDPGAEPTWGFRLRLCRLQLGLSQRALGQLLGFDQTTISQYELGVTDPGRINRLAINQFMEENQ